MRSKNMTEPLYATSLEKRQKPFDVYRDLMHSCVSDAIMPLVFCHIEEAPVLGTF